MQPNLRITGPTPLPPSVLQALSTQMVSHRSQAFKTLLRSVLTRLRPLMGAKEAAILPFTSSGTGGMEAALCNLVAPQERVLVVQTGYFGERFAQIARSLGAEVVPWDVPWGRAADPDELRRRVRAAAPVTAVLLTYNESSTGVCNPLAELASAVRAESDALILVDAVSAVGAMPLQTDDWGLDVAVTVTQKALMAPPGLALLSVSRRAQAIAKQKNLPRFYFDFLRMMAALEEGSTPFTPALSVVYALDAALDLIEAEGLPALYERHRQMAKECQTDAKAMGLALFADPAYASPAATAIVAPEQCSVKQIKGQLEQAHQVFIGTGKGPFKDRLIRIGHMGYVEPGQIAGALMALRQVLAPYLTPTETK